MRRAAREGEETTEDAESAEWRRGEEEELNAEERGEEMSEERAVMLESRMLPRA